MSAPASPPPTLYAITPDLDDTHALCAAVAAALAGGARWVQYRNKRAAEALRRRQAHALLALCRDAGATLIVNDDIELAAQVGAHGVHLGRDDGTPEAARQRLGAQAIVGVSCYAQIERAFVAARAGADYVAFGSVFASPTKPQAVRAPLALIGAARAQLALPIAAIGGITVTTATQVVAAGAHLLAVASGLFEAPDIARRAAEYLAALRAAAPAPTTTDPR